MNELFRVIEDAEEAGLFWDFFEDDPHVQELAARTIPGRIVQYLVDSAVDKNAADRTLGLLTAFVARRSLACWFLYCENEHPFTVANRLVAFWTNGDLRTGGIDDSWLIVAEPTENGVPIRDCRRSDTMSASSAVAHAARFAVTRSCLDATTALSHAFIAFDVSPLGDIKVFVRWIVEHAVPCAVAGRAMMPEEQFALADFSIPSVLLRTAI